MLLPYRPRDVLSSGYTNFRFTTIYNWGERPNGQWNLIVSNQNNFVNGTVRVTIHGITLYGTATTPQSVSRIPSQCHGSCDNSKGCGGTGAEDCDTCANLRNAVTLECIDACPQNYTQRNNYCYDDNVPEVGCIRSGSNSAVVFSSSTVLTSAVGLITIWLSTL